MTPNRPEPITFVPHGRRLSRGTALWIFGLATTVLLISTWGRAVSGDRETLTGSARAAVEASDVTARLSALVSEGLEDVVSMPSDELVSLVEEVARSHEGQEAIDSIIDEVVAAALAEPGSTAVVDIRDAVLPVVPVVAESLQRRGTEVPEDAIVAGLEQAGALAIDAEAAPLVDGTVARARSVLTRVVVTALVAMALAAVAAVALSDDRYRMMRSLGFRVALSAATFALLLRIGSWALDPDGGASPVAAGGAVLLAAHVWVPLAAVAAGVALAFATTFASRRRRAASRPG